MAHRLAAYMQEEAAGELDWDALYADQAPRVFNYFRFRLGGGGADVEDLTSRTFEKAWRSRARYRRDLALQDRAQRCVGSSELATGAPAHRCGR
jgi:DNA-directed RNA polymerase specialized sigma24 family protein